MDGKDISQRLWDLSPLYTGVDDPRIGREMDEAKESAERFRKDLRGRIAGSALTPELLAEALQRYEEIQRRGLLPLVYAQLVFYADGENVSTKTLLAKMRERWSDISETTLFFELEILRIDDTLFRSLVDNPDIAPYAHYLNQIRAHAPYTLSEEVEQAIKRKDLSGREAFVQLFDELTASFRFTFLMPDEENPREVTGEELLSLLHHPDGKVRERAFGTFLGKHGENALVLTSCFNNILLDHARESDLRRYPDIMTPTHLSSETDPETVERMMTVTEANYPLARDYFRLKGKLLGQEKMKNTDIYAPLSETARIIPYEEARRTVLESFESFSPRMAETAEAFFREGRIDALPRQGKTGGAFCMGMLPGVKPYVLLNYTGNLRDVATLAHELGHGVHFALSQKQNLFHYHAPLPLAETASVFGEMLLTRHLLEKETDRRARIEILCGKIEDIIATTFRQNLLTRFEQKAHRMRNETLLSPEALCDLWWEENARLFGESVEMIPPYRWGWSYISHFIHARFYCYSYVFGELLVLSLYRRYQLEGEAFVPLYLDLLSRGGSRPPEEMLTPLGIDLRDPGFWQGGYDFLESMIGELRALVETVKETN